MKYVLFGSVLLAFSVTAFSASYTTQVHSIDKGKKGKPHLIMFTNGHTAFLDGPDKSLIEEVEISLEKGDTVAVKLDKKLNLLSIQTVEPERIEPQEEIGHGDEILDDQTSVITLDQARSAFSGMRTNYQNESQCYNRAHIWSYEEFNRTNIKTNKLFLFFTTRYIRNYRYKWWFHVTPMAYVGGTSQSYWRTLDRRYTAMPLTVKSWTDVFMHNNATCPVVYKYSSYRNHQQSRDCYLIPTSMYYWQPRDIERREYTGQVRTQFYNSEISHAYWEAF